MGVKFETQQLQEAHRHFAVECNNKAWHLAEAFDVFTQRDELLNLAHASAYHWQAIGTELEKMRATMLLANVHAILGLSDGAQRLWAADARFFLCPSCRARLGDCVRVYDSCASLRLCR